MSIYSGFATRKIEETYNKLLSKLIVFLQNEILECFSLIQSNDDLLKLLKNILTESKVNKFQNIMHKMKLLQQHKYLQPKFSTFCEPLNQKLSILFLNDNFEETQMHKNFNKTFQSTPSNINSRKIFQNTRDKFNLTAKSRSSDKKLNIFKYQSSRKSKKFMFQSYSTQKVNNNQQRTQKIDNAQKIRIHKSSDKYIDYKQFNNILPVSRQLLGFQKTINKKQQTNNSLEPNNINKEDQINEKINTQYNNTNHNTNHNTTNHNTKNNNSTLYKKNIKEELYIHSQSQLIKYDQVCKIMPVFIKSNRYQNFNRNNFKNMIKKQKITNNIEDKTNQRQIQSLKEQNRFLLYKQIQNSVEQNLSLSNKQKVYKRSSQWYKIQKQIQERQEQR